MEYNTRLIGVLQPILNRVSGKKSTAKLISETLSEEHEFWKNRLYSSNDPIEREILTERLRTLETLIAKPDQLTVKENTNWGR